MLSTNFTNYGPLKPDHEKYLRLADRLVTRHGLSVERLNNWLKSRS